MLLLFTFCLFHLILVLFLISVFTRLDVGLLRRLGRPESDVLFGGNAPLQRVS